MLGNTITLIINLLSAIQWIEKDEELQRKILEIARDQIDMALKPKPTIADMRSVYETAGKIPAIKEWRSINAGMGLKDAKDQVEEAATRGDWKDHRVGKQATITAPNSEYDGFHGRVTRVVPNEGFYIKFSSRIHDVFFHSSAVNVHM